MDTEMQMWSAGQEFVPMGAQQGMTIFAESYSDTLSLSTSMSFPSSNQFDVKSDISDVSQMMVDMCMTNSSAVTEECVSDTEMDLEDIEDLDVDATIDRRQEAHEQFLQQDQPLHCGWN